MKTHAQWCTRAVLVLCLIAVQQATAGPLQQRQPAPRTTTAQQKVSSTVEELNKLPCERIRCNHMDQEPVCATGKGSAGCNMPDKGCTYTNGCMARCVYGATVSHMGKCTHPGAMSIAEDSKGSGTGEGQGRSTARTDCKCPWAFEPVCATVPACTIPGGCTYASECFAKCVGAKDIRKGACKNSRKLLLLSQQVLAI